MLLGISQLVLKIISIVHQHKYDVLYKYYDGVCNDSMWMFQWCYMMFSSLPTVKLDTCSQRIAM